MRPSPKFKVGDRLLNYGEEGTVVEIRWNKTYHHHFYVLMRDNGKSMSCPECTLIPVKKANTFVVEES